MRFFLGIRYAAPPLGDLRWRDPLPEPRWAGTADALEYGSHCLQNPRFGWKSIENRGNMSEDCLFLNVVAPPPRPQPYPVMVHIHAGEFRVGSGADRESDIPHFADDVILVSFNYRLGVFGFAGADDLRDRTPFGGTGNYGVHDQRAALRWVRSSIGAFGGDASNVLLWGESSGGTSVALHLVSPRSHGLFHKAILQSPGVTQVKSLADAALNYRYALAALLSRGSPGCVSGGGYATFPETRLESRGGRVVGWAANLSLAEARVACDAAAACRGFTLERRGESGSFNATLHAAAAPIFDVRAREGGAASRPAPISYLKAAREGSAGVECLLRASAAALVNVTDYLPRGRSFETNGFAPVVDGRDMRTTLVDQVAEGRFSDGVPVLIGSNLDEGSMFMELSPPLPCANASNASFAAWADAVYGVETAAAVVVAYQKLRAPLPHCSSHRPPPAGALGGGGAAAEGEVAAVEGVGVAAAAGAAVEGGEEEEGEGYYYMAAMRSAGDYAITCRVRQMARSLRRRRHRVYAYYFTHTPNRSINYANLESIGAFHGAEVPFAFYDAFELSTPDERALAADMGCYWRNFAHTGDPNRGPSPCVRAAVPPLWPEAGGDRATTLRLDVGAAGGIVPLVGLNHKQCDAFLPATSTEKAKATLTEPSATATLSPSPRPIENMEIDKPRTQCPGPGNGPWASDAPEAHGLSTRRLAEAAEAVARLAPERYCLLIIKDGFIVHESTFANSVETRYESDSLAKTASALLVGAAVEQGLFDLDTPLVAYDVPPCAGASQSCWRARCTGCPTGPLGFWLNQTARTILSQSTGCVTGEGCTHPPGTAFTYDSEIYVQHLATLIGTRLRASGSSDDSTLAFATRLMTQLGLPDFYANDDLGDEVLIGGGQLVSCRDVARLAQLVLNRGLWPTEPAAETATRLVAESYVDQMLSPQFPSRGFSYGFLTWLNAKHADYPHSASCCAPRWGPNETCSNHHLTRALLGDDLADLAPSSVAMGMGWLGQYMYIVPSRNLSIVSLGATWGSSQQCRLGRTEPGDPAYNDGYDDAFSASVIWHALDRATDSASGVESEPSSVASLEAKARDHADATRSAASRSGESGGGGSGLGSSGATANASQFGSCSCSCPPGRGFGSCYNLAAPSTTSDKCETVKPLAAMDCPGVGVVQQCSSRPHSGEADCVAAGEAMRGDIGSPTVWGGHLACSLRSGCSSTLALDPFAATSSCSCRAVRYGDYACNWSPQACTESPYYTPRLAVEPSGQQGGAPVGVLLAGALVFAVVGWLVFVVASARRRRSEVPPQH